MLIRRYFNGGLPRLVIFDLDGTLVDSVPDLALAIDLMLEALDLPLAGQERVRCWVGNGAQMLVQRALKEISPNEAIVFDRAFELFLHHYRDNLSCKSALYLGVNRALERCTELDIPMAIVTNKPIAFTHPLLSHLQIDGFFRDVLGGDSLSKKKPDPMPLLVLMDKYGLAPTEVLMVGDSVNDVRAARNAGCPVIAVPYGYNHGEDIKLSEPDDVVERLDLLF